MKDKNETEKERILETIKNWDYHPYKNDSNVFKADLSQSEKDIVSKYKY